MEKRRALSVAWTLFFWRGHSSSWDKSGETRNDDFTDTNRFSSPPKPAIFCLVLVSINETARGGEEVSGRPIELSMRSSARTWLLLYSNGNLLCVWTMLHDGCDDLSCYYEDEMIDENDSTQSTETKEVQ
jgi:hypothetical protein